jgi:hypothetical protein
MRRAAGRPGASRRPGRPETTCKHRLTILSEAHFRRKAQLSDDPRSECHGHATIQGGVISSPRSCRFCTPRFTLDRPRAERKLSQSASEWRYGRAVSRICRSTRGHTTVSDVASRGARSAGWISPPRARFCSARARARGWRAAGPFSRGRAWRCARGPAPTDQTSRASPSRP